MEPISEWNARIRETMDFMERQHPELLKYIIEMPLCISDIGSPVISANNLKEYYNSLTGLLTRYNEKTSLLTSS